MVKNLLIVESPGKIKSIKKFLGNSYKIEASVGHIRDLPKSRLGVDIENDFEPKYINIRGKGDVISNLKKEAKKADRVFLATDPDREGEAISWHLANILNIDEKIKCRVTFNEITQNAVKNAIKSPREIDMKLVDAQQARRLLDRIVGYQISPILWRKVRKGLSAGRVQSVAVRLICDREQEIDNFEPLEYWSLIANLSPKNNKKFFEAKFYGNSKNKIELKNREQVEKILEEIKDKEFIVKKINRGVKKKAAPPPFITSTLQQEASRKLGYTAKKTMIVAQQLYEGIDLIGQGTTGLITYMRTDSKRISSEAAEEAAMFITEKYGKEYIPQKPVEYKNRSASQDAHEAIRPAHIYSEPDQIKESLTKDQYKLYRLIWERFAASRMSPAVYDTVSMDINCSDYIFRASGSKIKFAGFLTVYNEGTDDEENEEEQTNIPDVLVNEALRLNSINPKQHFTQPPPRYTEATLVKELEEKGIGRPSTYAPIITTIISRGYVEREKRTLFPTELGKIVTDIMKNYFQDIVNVEFTAQMENKLDVIEEGSIQWKQILRDFYKGFHEKITNAESQIKEVEIQDEVTDQLCEKCGRNLVIKNGRYGKFLACPGYPECKNAKPIVEEAGVSCPLCGGKILIRKTRKGRKYLGCENYPECRFMTWEMASNKKCPQCGSFLTRKFSGKKVRYKCSSANCGFENEEMRDSIEREDEND